MALAVAGLGVAVAMPLHALAQQVAPSRVTPETLQPAPPPAAPISLPSAAGLTPPPNADQLFVEIGRVEVSGTFPGLEERTNELVRPLAGKRVSVAWIYETANALEHDYAQAGYFLARIVIPPQRLVDGGTVRFTVVDGVIERIDVKDVPERQRALVQARLAGIVGVRRLRLADVERQLLLISDIPGLQVRSTLTAGSTTGSTLFVMQGTQRYVTGSFAVDNRLPASLGTWSLSASGALNSALGLGEQIYASTSSSPDLGPARLRVFGGGFVLPLGNDGFTINPEYTKSMARPTPAAGTPATQGDFQRFALRGTYPLIRTRTTNLTVQGSVEWDDEELTPIGFSPQLYDDDYATARLRTVYTGAPLADWPVQLSGTLSQGLGGRTATSLVPLSRLGASPTFTSFRIEANAQHPLPAALLLTVTARAQTSFGKPLMLAEQFALDGIAAVSSFADGTFSVDQGVTLRTEFSRPVGVTLAQQNVVLSPYVFGAGGWGELVMPTALEHRDIGAGSAGIGLRADAGIVGVMGGTLAAEFARKFSDVPAVPPGYRANISLSLRF
jgi:hemolysin activation/secretion protein